jgi:hypothetical protein
MTGHFNIGGSMTTVPAYLSACSNEDDLEVLGEDEDGSGANRRRGGRSSLTWISSQQNNVSKQN